MKALEKQAKIEECQEKGKVALNIIDELRDSENTPERQKEIMVIFDNLQEEIKVLKEKIEADDGK